MTEFSEKKDISHLKNYYQIEDHVINQWLSKIEALLLLKTTKAKNRLTYEQRINALLPGGMRSNAEQKELEKITEKARKLYRTDRKELESWIQYQLMHCNSQNHQLPFLDVNQLIRFIATTMKLIPGNRIGIEVRCSKSNRKKWTSELPANIHIKHVNSENASSALLRIIHPDETGILERQAKRQSGVQKFNQYSTPVLHYLAYTVALTLFSVELLRSWSEGAIKPERS